MITELKAVETAMRSFISNWSQGLKDDGLFDKARAIADSLSNLAAAIESSEDNV